MMSELFDEQAQRDAYNEARDQEMLNEGKISVALRLIARGKDNFEDIADLTGLTLEKVNELAAKMKPVSA